ncbi:MAG: tetratricopeptide repeat protein [Elusimicrobia bacterium]|nr:tetratricopeptide repeat protein [Elusimicrobiota bacterium]
MKHTTLGLILLAAFLPAAAGGTPWTAQSLESGLETGDKLADTGHEHEALSVFLDVLKSSPGDKRALTAMKELAARAAAAAGAKSTAALDNARLYNALDDAGVEMLNEVREPELRLGFARARRLFNDGQLLLAYDVFLLLESRKPSQDWLKDEIRRYLRERLPREIERARVRGFYGINADLYCLNALTALSRSDWEGVYRNLGLWLNISVPGKPEQGAKLEKEAKFLLARMKSRISLSQIEERGVSWLVDARQSFLKQDYDGAVNMLEAFIPVAGGVELSARAWEQLGAAYDFNELLDGIAKTETALSRGQYAEASVLIANALERYPGSRKMAELKSALFEKIRPPAERGVMARVPAAEAPWAETPEASRTNAAQSPARISAGAGPKRVRPSRSQEEVPAPDAGVKLPTGEEKAAADSYYLQGISAYATGDFAKAVSSWNAALKLVPDHQKSLKALERLATETKGR